MFRLCACLTFMPLIFAAPGANPRLEQVRAVYVLPMRNGMDQYLANRLARSGKMEVVADPKSADAVLTDQLGEVFERKLNELYPPAKKDKKNADKGSTNVQEEELPVSSFGHGEGNYFLVDRATRAVLWSAYEEPKGTSSPDLDKTAERIIKRLVRDATPPHAAGGQH